MMSEKWHKEKKIKSLKRTYSKRSLTKEDEKHDKVSNSQEFYHKSPFLKDTMNENNSILNKIVSDKFQRFA